MSTLPAERQTRDLPVNTLKRVDIIWNVTLLCGWECRICCVDAAEVSKHGNEITIRSKGLGHVEVIPYLPGEGNAFDQALKHRQEKGLELDLPSKLRVLEHLEGFDVKIDISGGDPLLARENLEVLRAASSRLGPENVTLTATGSGLSGYDPAEIAPLIGELNFTFDSSNFYGNVTRPDGYAAGNFKRAANYAARRVKTRAECPLTNRNVDDVELLTRIYRELHLAGIGKLLIMRLFPVGRGVTRRDDIPTVEQYRRAISLFRSLEQQYGSPVVNLQCALKFLENADRDVPNPCDLLRESFGLTPNGTLLLSPWAIDFRGEPMHESWVLGNLAEQSLGTILNTPKVRAYAIRLDDNFGQCKIHAFLNSQRSEASDRIFDPADPLHASVVARRRSSAYQVQEVSWSTTQ
jgi:MoaA/NifB/PqqE/SkfB family radical SAM enzyme